MIQVMESTEENRFDPNIVRRLLLEMAHEQSLGKLLLKILDTAIARTAVTCAQFWLVEKGDLCAKCPRHAECPDQTRCLHLLAGRAVSLLGNDQKQSWIEDPNARIPLGTGSVGEAVAKKEQVFLKDPAQLVTISGFDSLQQEQRVECGITPIVFKEEVLGVLIGFSRQDLPRETRLWGQVVADHVGAAIANARAFEEIQRLKAQLEQRNTYLQEEVVEAKAFGSVVGQSAALRHIISQIDLVAPTEASVLILGETGTGKELVAHEIHRRSRRKEGPLIRVNCASIPRELFESEFFGHVKGAFTGAIKDRAGRFEAAEGGTIFLDEIGEVPLDMQSKLLRVLHEKLYERVGDDRTRSADVRIIGATNRELKKAVAAGRFREDLYYRLNVFPIQVLPLRERMDDVPLLAKHFVELSTRELKCDKPRLTRAAVAKLQSYNWPGNVRELRNVIERAVILARGGALDFDLPVVGQPAPPSRANPREDCPSGNLAQPKFLTETEVQLRERENLAMVLEAANWKIKGPNGAAELLGIKPSTLLSRMHKWGLKKPESSDS